MCNSKICFKCNESQPLTEFYKHSQMVDGHLNKCKSCTKKDTKENRLKNYDYYIEYDKNRANLPHRAAARLAYTQTEKGKEMVRNKNAAYTANNAIKRGASHIINNAVRDKRIVKPNNCEVCNIVPSLLHGHHDDYAYPLSVRWLCPKCHASWHKLNGSAING